MQHSLITDKQVKEYVSQWHLQQESIGRLTAMEDDLQLLIMALSSQSELTENPPLLMQSKIDITYGNQPSQNLEPTALNNTPEVKTPNLQNSELTLTDETKIGAQLGWYLKPELVKARVEKLKQLYPSAFTQFNFTMFERKNNNMTLYGLRVGPFKNDAQVSAFCYLANQLAQVCNIAAFVGKPI
ncbi:SPOR domain-containing protein [Pseudoalteromonas sp. SG43-3]|uniref:SPOR domain-containing protein n=1 Tax=Pseudoalteromonas sp. SG43-3 TaxID=2760970 RepID=UPI001603F29E|nr:SPOR domain-containing protein [Pseudoalteromonas sp. SG43-3]MBB1441920.1 SPOR domain-containing protein [Pseudoalteromonas sp. SG43-3]